MYIRRRDCELFEKPKESPSYFQTDLGNIVRSSVSSNSLLKGNLFFYRTQL